MRCTYISPRHFQAIGGEGAINYELAAQQYDGYVAALSKIVDAVEVNVSTLARACGT